MSAASQPSHDRNLLFGMLALQLDFITREQLLEAMQAWVFAKHKSLAQILTEHGSLTTARCALLEALVNEHLAQHQDDPQQSLAALSPVGSVRRDLEEIPDDDLQASVRRLSVAHSDPYATEDPLSRASTVPLRYRVLRRHAKGGLGEVFLAQDEELKREVALKEIRSHRADDPDSRARFLREAEITGGLEHPGIVPVYGLGTYADGRPYYAMRFIKGDSLQDAIKHFHTPEALRRSPGERTLELRRLLGRFLDVCNALAYAHSRGVLHRDLKPGNIMLGKYGETLVVDWGLAKPLGQAEGEGGSEQPLVPASGTEATPTIMGQLKGTPLYMSPEQAAGRLDLLSPASDVYSLGATLYHLLTGKPPVQGRDVAEVAAKVARGEIVPPRQANPQTPPALAAICLKAMALPPAERYASALALAAEVEHWLAEEPVAAWPEPLSVRVWRWVKLHRTAVSSTVVAVAVAALMLAGATVLLTAAYDSEAKARVVAEKSEKEAKEKGDEALAAELRERQAKAQESAVKVKAQEYFAKAQDTVDKMLTRVSENKDLLLYEPRLEEIRRKLLDDALGYYQGFLREKSDDPGLRKETARAYGRLGYVQGELGKLADAEHSYREALKLQKQLADDFPKIPLYRSDLAKSYNNLGFLLQKVGRAKEAEEAYREALKLQKQLADDFPKIPLYRSDLALSHNNLGALLDNAGNATEAEQAYREALKLQQQLADDFPMIPEYRSDLALSHNNLGFLLQKVGHAQEAEQAYREALKVRQQLADDFPKIPQYRSDLASSHNNLGVLLNKAGRAKEAEQAYREALQLQQQLADDFPKIPQYRSELAISHNNLGLLLDEAGRAKEAEQAYREALQVQKQLVEDFPKIPLHRSDLAASHNNLAILLEKTGRLKEAEASLRDALKVQQLLTDNFPKITSYRNILANRHNDLGSFLEERERLQDAEEAYHAGLKIRKQLVEELPKNFANRKDLADDYHRLALLLQTKNRLPETEKLYHAAIVLWKQLLEELPKDAFLQGALAASLNNLGVLAANRSDLQEAKNLLEQAITNQHAALTLAPKNVNYRNELTRNHTNLADILVRLKNHAAAVKAAAEVLRIAPSGWQEYQRGALFTSQAIALAAKDAQLTDAQRKETIAAYSVQAVQLLQQAVQRGYGDLAALKKEAAFAPLRDRPDFQKLLSKLDGKTP